MENMQPLAVRFILMGGGKPSDAPPPVISAAAPAAPFPQEAFGKAQTAPRALPAAGLAAISAAVLSLVPERPYWRLVCKAGGHNAARDADDEMEAGTMERISSVALLELLGLENVRAR